MLQPLRISVNCFPIVISRAYIFSQSKIQRNNLKPLLYNNADQRANEAEAFFKNDLKFDHTEICSDMNKQQIFEKFAEIQKFSDEFEMHYKKEKQSVLAIAIVWVGFKMIYATHPIITPEDYDHRIFPNVFELSCAGEPMCLSQRALLLAKNEKTQVMFFEDS